jgi:hypothetical protein
MESAGSAETLTTCEITRHRNPEDPVKFEISKHNLLAHTFLTKPTQLLGVTSVEHVVLINVSISLLNLYVKMQHISNDFNIIFTIPMKNAKYQPS